MYHKNKNERDELMKDLETLAQKWKLQSPAVASILFGVQAAIKENLLLSLAHLCNAFSQRILRPLAKKRSEELIDTAVNQLQEEMLR